MPSRSHLGVDEKLPRPRSASPSPSRKKKSKLGKRVQQRVKDNDIFLLPAFDYQILAGLLIIALGVRLFRIYQPSSVVFDEVQ
jgi:dolichyl-phosphate-mannose-protein mannosyltransferase